MVQLINYLRNFIETHAFGVCAYLGEKLRIPSRYIRLFFIYSTFIATWSPVILYLILAFWVNLKDYIKAKKSEIWDF